MTAVKDKPNLLTLDELASYLRMQKVTIYKHVQEGKVPGFKIGSKWRFKKTSIDKWIAKKEKSSDK